MNRPSNKSINIQESYDPDHINLQLLECSQYIVAYEFLRSSIIDNLAESYLGKEYYNDNIDNIENRDLLERIIKYETDVKVKINSPDKYKLLKSSEWLLQHGVITEEDINIIKIIRDRRNRIAHELPSFIYQEFHFSDNDYELFNKLQNILLKIDSFWYTKEQIPELKLIKERLNYRIVDESNASGRIALLQIINLSIWKYAASLIHVRKIWRKGRMKPIKRK